MKWDWDEGLCADDIIFRIINVRITGILINVGLINCIALGI